MWDFCPLSPRKIPGLAMGLLMSVPVILPEDDRFLDFAAPYNRYDKTEEVSAGPTPVLGWFQYMLYGTPRTIGAEKYRIGP